MALGRQTEHCLLKCCVPFGRRPSPKSKSAKGISSCTAGAFLLRALGVAFFLVGVSMSSPSSLPPFSAALRFLGEEVLGVAGVEVPPGIFS